MTQIWPSCGPKMKQKVFDLLPQKSCWEVQDQHANHLAVFGGGRFTVKEASQIKTCRSTLAVEPSHYPERLRVKQPKNHIEWWQTSLGKLSNTTTTCLEFIPRRPPVCTFGVPLDAPSDCPFLEPDIDKTQRFFIRFAISSQLHLLSAVS